MTDHPTLPGAPLPAELKITPIHTVTFQIITLFKPYFSLPATNQKGPVQKQIITQLMLLEFINHAYYYNLILFWLPVLCVTSSPWHPVRAETLPHNNINSDKQLKNCYSSWVLLYPSSTVGGSVALIPLSLVLQTDVSSRHIWQLGSRWLEKKKRTSTGGGGRKLVENLVKWCLEARSDWEGNSRFR